MKVLKYLCFLAFATLSQGKASDGDIFGQKNNPFLSPHAHIFFQQQGKPSVFPFMNLPPIPEDKEEEPRWSNGSLIVSPKVAEDLKRLKLNHQILNMSENKNGLENKAFQFPTEKLNELMAKILADVMEKEKVSVPAASPHLRARQARNPFLSPPERR